MENFDIVQRSFSWSVSEQLPKFESRYLTESELMLVEIKGEGLNIRLENYKNELDIDIIYAFEADPGKHLIDNLRIPAFKPNGIIFNNPENANKWKFKIVVITSNGIYSANRYVTENIIGCY